MNLAGEFIDFPAPMTLLRAQYMLKMRLEPGGGVIAYGGVGILDNLQFGISWGGDNIIGYGDARFYSLPGVQIFYKFFNDPAVMLGFNSQGYGHYEENTESYSVKSRGIFLTVGKSFFNIVTLAGGVNYCSIEREAPQKVDIFFGCAFNLTKELTLLMDYEAGLNDPQIKDFRGYLNAGLRFTFEDVISVEIDFRNLTETNAYDPGSNTGRINRTVKIIYRDFL